MASGPEHYREAERLLERSAGGEQVPAGPPGREESREAARVHALLALAAATAVTGTDEAWRAATASTSTGD